MKYIIILCTLLTTHSSRAADLLIQAELQNAENASALINFLQCLSEEQISWDLVQDKTSQENFLLLQENEARILATFMHQNKTNKTQFEAHNLVQLCQEITTQLKSKEINLAPSGYKINPSNSYPSEPMENSKQESYIKRNWLPISVLALLSASILFVKTQPRGIREVVISP